MRLFRCQVCGQTVYFENTHCERCRSLLGYLPEVGLMSAINQQRLALPVTPPGAPPGARTPRPEAPSADDRGEVWIARIRPGERYRLCANAGIVACNWLVPASSPQTLCAACRHNNRVSDPRQNDNLGRWRLLENAKRRLFYSLMKLDLPMPTRARHPEGLAFDFLADPPDPKAPRVMSGHAKGLITIALREADDVEREIMRTSLGEPYRTLLGHFRHETGHYFWDRLVRDDAGLGACRAIFGDDRANYGQAIKTYYAKGAPADWRLRFISAYATMHPWEDFAETWAHYLHMIDTLETAGAHGVSVKLLDGNRSVQTVIDFSPYTMRDFDTLVNNWLPLSLAANSLNRSMGQPDLYPFVLSPAVTEKLRFVHDLIQRRRT